MPLLRPYMARTMLGRLFKKAAPSRPLDTARVPDGVRVYAIGDIHGRNDLLTGGCWRRSTPMTGRGARRIPRSFSSAIWSIAGPTARV
jgi:hypothetical protein